MTAGDDPTELLPMFETFRDRGIVSTSPVYERLVAACTEEPDLAAPLLAAPKTERLPLLLFAAVQYLLRNDPREGDEALAAYYPSLEGGKQPDSDLVQTFREFVTRRDADLRELTATRVTQTNEARRAAVIRPALAKAQRRAEDRALALVEVGCSSGLMLLPDRYGYRYTQPNGDVLEFGNPAIPDLVLETQVSGTTPIPDWLATTPLSITSRVGIDRNPIAADDADQANWLRACIWPEHLDRLARLDAALHQARQEHLDLRTGDLNELLPTAVAEAPPNALVVVLSSHVTPYMTNADRRRFASLIADLAQTRDLMLVLNEDRQLSEVFGVPAASGEERYIANSLIDHTTDEGPTAAALAKVDPHGSWLEWL